MLKWNCRAEKTHGIYRLMQNAGFARIVIEFAQRGEQDAAKLRQRVLPSWAGSPTAASVGGRQLFSEFG
jgi:hypothetical protein